jgi:tRNA (guanine-N7-)-methyltransferase
MYGNSRLPASAQTGVHAHLAMLLDRHVKAPFRKPYADYNRSAFAASFERFQRVAAGAPLILDSCCGVGESSRLLARAFPNHYVIGVDQSASRLARGRGRAAECPANLDLVRADMVDYWRLLHDGGCQARPSLPAVSQPVAEDRPPEPPLAWPSGFPHPA